VRFGIEFDEPSDAFTWQVTLVPAARYQRIDDLVWQRWRTSNTDALPPGSVHHDKSNTVRFVSRPMDAELTAESAFKHVKCVLEVVLGVDPALAEAILGRSEGCA